MPAHRIVGIHAVDLVWGLGTLHCLTQQEPLDRRCDDAMCRKEWFVEIACLDLEGVLVPEIWIEFARIDGYRGTQGDHQRCCRL